jgi:hypothetical protein
VAEWLAFGQSCDEDCEEGDGEEDTNAAKTPFKLLSPKLARQPFEEFGNRELRSPNAMKG